MRAAPANPMTAMAAAAALHSASLRLRSCFAFTVAASADIVFVSAAREGDRLTATAVERHRAGKSGIYDVTVRCGDKLIAEFRGLSRTLST